MPQVVDCLIVGGGPAGLLAATYLGRFRRAAILVDDDDSRAGWIPSSHNIPGFPDGVSGRGYLSLLREQAIRYGAEMRRGRIDHLVQDGAQFHASGAGLDVVAANVILATGVVDRLPDLPDPRQAVARGLLRLCPVCDGYEATGKNVGIAGPLERAVPEGRFLQAFTDRITVLALPENDGSRRPAEALDVGEGLRLAPSPLRRLSVEDGRIVALLAGGEALPFDTVYAALGNTPRTTLAQELGAERNDAGCIVTDDHQRTSIPGLYAIGDVADALNQVSVASGHAALAATDVHNRLRTTRP